ncbi:dihydrofolate reductase family protein [Antrihabitans cavernicola]|uniref:Dihydrofolate reductase n=1 Tax=Antrihabitans cavernicola TaxID=2495913 RepID=A0A5A7S9H7_9NOCA|nr:dihydrofolate reductase family protein [Spelaeibacter cavernicola]KAA0022134.1 dihydrofolate reductase [Spelaeibacter cavernicola]
MATLSVVNSMTLDGVIQAPAQADEDPSNGFTHGGWAAPYADTKMMEAMGAGVAGDGVLLIGRRTYDDFAAAWPKAPADNPFTKAMHDYRKYVVSSTLTEPLEWHNSTLLAGDAIGAVARLKDQLSGNITILGSGTLIRSLLPHNLIDTLTLLIHPLVLGAGIRMFDDDSFARLNLTKSTITDTGVVIATYEPAA